MGAGIVTVATNLPWGMILEKAPAIFEKTTQLVQSLRRSRNDLSVEADVAQPGDGVADAAKVEAAIKDIEESLMSLNQQVTEAGTLIQELADANQLLTGALAKQRLISLSAGIASLVALAFAGLSLLQ